MHFLYHDSYFKRKVQSVLNYDSWANMLVKDRKLATAGLGQVKKCACVCVCVTYIIINYSIMYFLRNLSFKCA